MKEAIKKSFRKEKQVSLHPPVLHRLRLTHREGCITDLKSRRGQFPVHCRFKLLGMNLLLQFCIYHFAK